MKSGLTGQTRGSALATNKNSISIFNTMNRASMVSQGAMSVRSAMKSVTGSHKSKKSMMSTRTLVSVAKGCQTNQVYSMPLQQPISSAPTKIAGDYASIHQMTEEQKFSTAFSAAIDEADKKTKFQAG